MLMIWPGHLGLNRTNAQTPRQTHRQEERPNSLPAALAGGRKDEHASYAQMTCT